MKTYEAIFVARPALSDDEVGKLRDKIRGHIEKNGGAVIKADDWGKRKLSFEIAREKKGAYLHFQLSGEGKVVKELERLCTVEENIIRSLIVKADPAALQSGPAVPPVVERPKEGEAGGQLQ